jgi:hypothetical protein
LDCVEGFAAVVMDDDEGADKFLTELWEVETSLGAWESHRCMPESADRRGWTFCFKENNVATLRLRRVKPR